MTTIPVKTPTGQYNIFIQDGILSAVGQHLQALNLAGRCAIVTNTIVGPLYADKLSRSLSEHGFKPVTVSIPDGEHYKTLQTVSNLYSFFLEAGLDRQSLILALGGGVVGDIAGFAAASFLRGVRFVQVPTSLLAMVDASVGGKTGVDLPEGKNLVGAFKQPEAVFIDPQVLETLPDVEFRSGLAEVVKHGILTAPHLFEALEATEYQMDWLLTEAIKVKVAVVQEDPFEQGRRAILNLGHTFAHAFETLSEFQIRHGEAVAMGLVYAANLAVNLGHCTPPTAERITNLVKQIGLPTAHPGFAPDAIWAAMGSDKKKEDGQLRFILPRAIGDVDIFSDVPREAVLNILQSA
jgi:3-dehydroquinate synthase